MSIVISLGSILKRFGKRGLNQARYVIGLLFTHFVVETMVLVVFFKTISSLTCTLPFYAQHSAYRPTPSRHHIYLGKPLLCCTVVELLCQFYAYTTESCWL